MKEYDKIVSCLEDFELEVINSIINDNSILSKFEDIENIDDDFINFLLSKEDNLLTWAHKHVLCILITYYFSLKENISKEYTSYFNCFSNQDFGYFNDENVTTKLVGFDSNDIVIILELLQVSFLNSQIQFKNGKLTRKKSKLNFESKGAVYTSDDIAKKITVNTITNQLNNGLDKNDLRIIDFGCGTGRFYLSAFDYLVNSLSLDEHKVISENLYGIDIDEIAIDILKIKVLNNLKNPSINDLENISQNILCKNMLLHKRLGDENSIDFNNDFVNLENNKFNVILSNPPYFLLKINKKGKNKRLNEYYKSLKNKIKEETDYFRSSGLYNYSIEGMLNYYKLSIERMINISSKNAEIGIICPSTLFGDLSSKKLRSWILLKHKLRGVEYFPESANLFDNVSQSTVIFYLNKNGETDEIDIDINGESFRISLNLIREIFGDNLEIAYVNEIGWNILEKLSKFKKIKDYEHIRNKRGELDLSLHRDCITNTNTGWRLVRGNMLSNIDEDINNEYVLIEDFLDSKSDEYKNNDFGKIRLLCHQISNIDKVKRLQFVKSKSNDIIGNSCNYIYFNEELCPNLDISDMLNKLEYILNSYLLNWRFKITSSNNHINNYEIDELPLVNLKKIPNLENKSELEINICICKLFNLNLKEATYILNDFFDSEEIKKEWGENIKLYNHLAPGFSDLEWQMVEHIPEGGNWKNIPESVPSKRLEQIRRSGGRTTYYGRLRRDKPSYTISTYFNRLGNGCYIHPTQDRLISLREGARLQSFRDSFFFCGPKTSIYKQIGNAVPPLLGRVIAELIKPYLKNKNYIDLFCGAGGLSEGFKMEDYELLGSIEMVKHFFNTFKYNHSTDNNEKFMILGDITEKENRDKLISIRDTFDIGAIVGGPPCQGFSTAGCRDPNDERNQLFRYFVDCVDKIHPEMFVMENVPGILSMQKGAVIKEIRQSFEEIGYYVSEPFRLNAEEFGVPQRRKRVFIIGSVKKIRIREPEPLFSEKDSNLPNPITVQQAIGNLPILNAGEGDMILELEDNIIPTSPYEELMMGNISFDEFYKKCSVRKTSVQQTLI